MRWLVPFIFVGAAAYGQSDIIGTAGQFAAQTGAKGAVANRQLADQLYKQSLADEHAAWSGGLPNVGLLSKALSESKDAKTADDQAKEFARAALYGGQTGGASGDYQAARYGGLAESQLKDLSNNSSPYAAAVQEKLGGYGMKLSSDQMSLHTPLGDYPVGMSGQDFTNAMVNAAKSLGFGGDSIAQGVADANKTRDALAAGINANVGGTALAAASGSKPSAGGAGVVTAGATSEATTARVAASVATTGAAPARPVSGDTDWLQRLRTLEANQNAIRRQLGLSERGITDPLGRPEEDLFQRVHVRYQALEQAGYFLTGVH